MNCVRFLALCLLLGGCDRAPAPPADPPLAGARIGGSFALTDQHGRRFIDRQLAGRYRIMYFGYTSCPDVCPTDAQAIGAGLKRFEGQRPALAAQVVPVFVTLDPARDTPRVLGAFVAAFHPRMIALTGSDAAIASLAKAYGMYFDRGRPNADGGYLVNHSRQTYLMDKAGRPLALLPTDKGADAVAAELGRWVT